MKDGFFHMCKEATDRWPLSLGQWLSSRDRHLGDFSGLFLMATAIATPGIMSAFKEESLFTLFYLKNRSMAPGSSLDRSCWPELQGGWESAH